MPGTAVHGPLQRKLGSSMTTAARLEFAGSGARVLKKQLEWSRRPRHEFAPAIRALTAEHRIRTPPTECALERAYERLLGIGRQVAIAALTIRT